MGATLSLSRNKLKTLIEEEDWDLAFQRLDTDSGITEVRGLSLKKKKELWRQVFRQLQFQPSSSIDNIIQLAVSNPDSLCIRLDKEGHTPVHRAIADSAVPFPLIYFMILSARRIGRTTIKSDGEYLLHFAARHGANSQLLELIHDSYHEAAGQRDHGGNLPLHTQVRCGRAFLSGPQADPVNCLLVMLKANVDAARVRDEWGMLPLHTVACYDETHDGAPGQVQKMIKMLHIVYPGALQELTRKNESVLSLTCRVPHEIDVARILFLFDKNPKAAVTVDRHGKVPFQHIRRLWICSQLLKAFCESNGARAKLAVLRDDRRNNMVHLLSKSVAVQPFSPRKLECIDRSRNSILLSGMVKMLPELAFELNDQRELPLHACLKSSGGECVLNDVVTLVEAYAESVIQTDSSSGLAPFMLAALDNPSHHCVSSTYFLFQRFVGCQAVDTLSRICWVHVLSMYIYVAR
jgi:hypothetical protein